jgi:hypothetical protein
MACYWPKAVAVRSTSLDALTSRMNELSLWLTFVGIAVVIALPAALLVWFTRRRILVTVVTPTNEPVPNAIVVGHCTRRFGGYVNSSGWQTVDGTTDEITTTLGRTDASGCLDRWLYLANPWALHATHPTQGSSPVRMLEGVGPHSVHDVTLVLDGNDAAKSKP